MCLSLFVMWLKKSFLSSAYGKVRKTSPYEQKGFCFPRPPPFTLAFPSHPFYFSLAVFIYFQNYLDVLSKHKLELICEKRHKQTNKNCCVSVKQRAWKMAAFPSPRVSADNRRRTFYAKLINYLNFLPYDSWGIRSEFPLFAIYFTLLFLVFVFLLSEW